MIGGSEVIASHLHQLSRRDDAPAQAGRLYNELADHFGKYAVYRDVDSMKPGVDFVDRIERELRSSAVVVAMIGESWLDITDASGRRRLDLPNDYVRLELATAVRQGKPVIPLLVNRARMPGADELPEDLAPLARRNALELADQYWKWGIRELLEALEEIVGAPEQQVVDSAEQSSPRRKDAKAAEDLEAEPKRFRREGAVREFLASRGIAVGE